MTNNRRARLWVSCLLVLWSAHGFAQSDAVEPPGPPPAHLSLIEGRVFVDREGRSDSAVANLPLLDGDRVRTEDGRAEVILPDGSLLHLDRDTTVDLLATDLLRLLSGRVYVIARGARDPQRAVRYQLDAPVASVQTGGPGEFRVWAAESARGREVELAVYRGQATMASSYGAEELRAGERSVVRDGLAPSAPQYFNSARWDEFDRWSATRRDQLLGTTSAQYLPSELAVYSSTFDQYRLVAIRPGGGCGLVSLRGGGLASLLGGLLGQLPGLELVLDRGRPVGVAHAPLRLLGVLLRLRLVLEARTGVGPVVGALGLLAGLRELVPARPLRVPGVRPLRRARAPLRQPRRSVARVDRGAARPLRLPGADAPRRG